MARKKTTYKALGDLLYQERMKRGMTTRELAKIVGVSHTTIYKYEYGVCEPRISHLKWIAEALHIPLIKLVERI